MAENKTQKREDSPLDFILEHTEGQRQEDCLALIGIMEKVTQAKAARWGDLIIGFGDYTYRLTKGKAMGWFYCGFAPRANTIALYTMGGVDRNPDLLARLGKYKTIGSCIHIKKLSDIDIPVLEEMLRATLVALREKERELGL